MGSVFNRSGAGRAGVLMAMALLGALVLPGCGACGGVGECRSDSDCGAKAICLEGRCHRSCNQDNDCTRVERCLRGVCRMLVSADRTPVDPVDASPVDVPTTDVSTAADLALDLGAVEGPAVDRGPWDRRSADQLRDLNGHDRGGRLDGDGASDRPDGAVRPDTESIERMDGGGDTRPGDAFATGDPGTDAAVPEICEAAPGARCFYIDPIVGDDDVGDGSFSNPWRSFVWLTSYYDPDSCPAEGTCVKLVAGDVVYLREGVHDAIFAAGIYQNPDDEYHVIYLKTVLGSEGRPVVIKSYPGERAIVDGQGSCRPVKIAQSEWIELRDLHVRNGNQAGIYLGENTGITLNHLEVFDNRGVGYYGMSGVHAVGGHQLLLEASTLYDNYRSDGNGGNLRIEGVGGVVIRNNEFLQPVDPSHGAYCIYNPTNAAASAFFLVHDNRFVHCVYNALRLSTSGAHVHHNTFFNSGAVRVINAAGESDLRDVVVEYNTIVGSIFNLDPSSDQADTFGSFVFRRNIIYHAASSYQQDSGIVHVDYRLSDAVYDLLVPELTMDHNCYYNPVTPPMFNFAAGTTSADGGQIDTLGGLYSFADWQTTYGYDQNSLVVDPQFVDEETGDLTLLPGSPCTDRGAYAN